MGHPGYDVEAKLGWVKAQKRGATIQSIAKKAGVNPSTVSRALKQYRDGTLGVDGRAEGQQGRINRSWVGEYKRVGEPPDDELIRIQWIGKLVALTAREASTDPRMDPAARRAEIRQAANTLTRLVSYDRLAKAEALIRGDAHALTGTGTGDDGLADAEEVSGRIIRGQNSRGRPSNRTKIH